MRLSESNRSQPPWKLITPSKQLSKTGEGELSKSQALLSNAEYLANLKADSY
jgi:hypothetical protein